MQNRNRTPKKNGNGQGTIYFSQALNCYVGQYINEMGIRKTLKQKKNEKVADFKTRFNETKNADSKGTLIEKSNETIVTILEKHIEYKHKNNITSDRTFLRDKGTLEQIKNCCNDICDMPIQKITTSHIQNASPYLTIYSKNSIDKIWRFIRKAFKIAVSDRLITYNPMDNLNISKPKSIKLTKTVEALTVEEHKKLIEVLTASNTQYNNILLLQLYTGMRIGEVLALSNDCINLKDNTITVYRTLTRDSHDKVIMGKTAKTQAGTRTIFMTQKTIDLCKNILDTNLSNKEKLLFWDYKKNFYVTPNELNCYLKRLCAKYEICSNIHTHMLRHTYATRFIEAGGSAKVLQNLLGHKDIETTLNTYTSVFDKFTETENQKYVDYMNKIGL